MKIMVRDIQAVSKVWVEEGREKKQRDGKERERKGKDGMGRKIKLKKKTSEAFQMNVTMFLGYPRKAR